MTATAALKLLSAIPKQDRAALQKAHEYASQFHAAMSRALEAEQELDAAQRENTEDRAYWANEHQDALGAAAVQMQSVPVKWLAILGVPVP